MSEVTPARPAKRVNLRAVWIGVLCLALAAVLAGVVAPCLVDRAPPDAPHLSWYQLRHLISQGWTDAQILSSYHVGNRYYYYLACCRTATLVGFAALLFFALGAILTLHATFGRRGRLGLVAFIRLVRNSAPFERGVMRVWRAWPVAIWLQLAALVFAFWGVAMLALRWVGCGLALLFVGMLAGFAAYHLGRRCQQ